MRENLRGGVESLKANLRPLTHTQAFECKWWCKFTLKLARVGLKVCLQTCEGRLKVCMQTCEAGLKVCVQTFVES